MEQYLSPSFKHEKLDNPSFSDLIDVFEDLWRHYIFNPVKCLIEMPYGDIAAMTVLCSYYESIQCCMTGKSSNKKSRKFFIEGFMRVFSSDAPDTEKAAGEIYKYIRCNLAHMGLFNYKVSYSHGGAKTFFLKYKRKPDGSEDFDSGISSIIVNPKRMYEGTEKHFNVYIKKLRKYDNQDLCDSFRKTVERQWGLSLGDNIVGMSEAEFLGKA
jgi:hypothetical protein